MRISVHPDHDNPDDALLLAFGESDQPYGWLRVHKDETAAYAGQLQCYFEAPLRTAIHLIHAGAVWLKDRRGAHGVLIHTDGKNINRPTYKRLGFVPVHGCPGLYSAPLCDVITAAQKRLTAHKDRGAFHG